jgi:hypothetical protein
MWPSAFDSGMLARMNDTDERNPGRELSMLRWGSTKVDRLVSELVARSGELTAEQRLALGEIVSPDAAWLRGEDER